MPDYTGTLLNGDVVSVRSIDPVETSMFVDFVMGYFNNPIKDETGYREMTSEEITVKGLEIARINALAKTTFTKLQIRRALRELGIESTLDNLLNSNETFKKDWSDAQEIDLSDTMTAQALASVSVDIDQVKLKIAGLE